MNPSLYDSLGVNDSVFRALYYFHGPFLDTLWHVLSYGYGYWMAALAAIVISLFYLRNRRTLSTHHATVLVEMMAVLILSFSLVWCAIYTAQTVLLWPRPWMLYPEAVAQPAVLLWHEGFPASAPAIAMMISALCWRYAGRAIRIVLSVYVVLGSVLCIVSGQSWPVDVVFGLLVGYAGVRMARSYYRFGTRLAAA